MSAANAHRTRQWLQLALICLSFVPVTIDATILYVAIPPVVTALGADAIEMLWIVDIYPFVTAGLVLLTGPLGDRFGHQRMLLVGLLVFAVASALAAYSWSPEMLIAARALKGAGGAMIVPSSLALIRILFDDPKQRAVGIGLWGALASAGSASGPVIGGLLLEHFWWGSLFLVNVPVALGLAAVLSRLIPNRILGLGHAISPLSPFLGLTGVLAVVYALKRAAHGDFLSLVPVMALLVGLAALILFVRRELSAEHPLLDLRLFAIGIFRTAVFAAILTSMTLIGFELFLTQYLQMVVGLSAFEAGLAFLPFPIAGVIFGPIGGYLNGRIGSMQTAAIGIAVAIIGYVAISMIDLHSVGWELFVILAVISGGHALTMSAATNAIMSSAPEERAGAAAGIESVSFEFGAGLGVAFFGSIMTAVYIRTFVAPSGMQIDPGHSLGEALRAAQSLPAAFAEQLVAAARSAYLDGFHVIQYAAIAILVAIGAIVLARMARPDR
ncbi:MFS transporter [Rhizobium alvei]|uniref:MFS transporter n=1 Tax=Rhizobium alvei TaxID=1132659 RepID=A0ABT8YF09_9HYPH|nr:MFS transporter [Rhizobium alvei]MDO6962323.1 MFS transporter [Rhizobium alvei]